MKFQKYVVSKKLKIVGENVVGQMLTWRRSRKMQPRHVDVIYLFENVIHGKSIGNTRIYMCVAGA